MTGTILTYMQDREADGIVLTGPPGAAKSAVAKATGNTAGIPTIAFDLAAMESSMVGASTDRLRTALKIIDAVSQGRMLFIGTCNSIASLPPELRRRFTLGTFFFDLPTAEEREVIWQIYFRLYSRICG
jgi:SpoVK/Ycf46/Vps4 family AAA+-type ATPase